MCVIYRMQNWKKPLTRYVNLVPQNHGLSWGFHKITDAEPKMRRYAGVERIKDMMG